MRISLHITDWFSCTLLNICNYAPTYFNGVWPKNTSRNNEYNLRNNDDFTLNPGRIKLFKRIPLYSFALEWNAIEDLKFQYKIKNKNKNKNILLPLSIIG